MNKKWPDTPDKARKKVVVNTSSESKKNLGASVFQLNRHLRQKHKIHRGGSMGKNLRIVGKKSQFFFIQRGIIHQVVPWALA